VRNLTLHLLSMPNLEISQSVRLPLGTGMWIHPLEKCRDIIGVRTATGDRSYHRLDEDPLRLRPLRRGVPGRCWVGTTRLRDDRVKHSLRVVRGQRAIDLPYLDVAATAESARRGIGALPPGWTNYRVTNGGRSAVLVLANDGLHAIRDLDRPKLEPIPGVSTNFISKLAGDPASDRVFIATWQNDDGELPYRSSLSRVSPNAGTGVEHLTDLGPHAPDYLEYLPGQRLVVYRGGSTGPVLFIDGDSGEVRMEISDVRANAPMSVVAGRMLVDDRVVDVDRGEFVGVLPGLKGISAQMLGKDRRYLVYMAPSDERTWEGPPTTETILKSLTEIAWVQDGRSPAERVFGPLSQAPGAESTPSTAHALNRVVVFDLTTLKVIASATVQHTEPQISPHLANRDPDTPLVPHVLGMFETESGKLAVLSADLIFYPAPGRRSR
jgi:hypothetical protein